MAIYFLNWWHSMWNFTELIWTWSIIIVDTKWNKMDDFEKQATAVIRRILFNFLNCRREGISSFIRVYRLKTEKIDLAPKCWHARKPIWGHILKARIGGCWTAFRYVRGCVSVYIVICRAQQISQNPWKPSKFRKIPRQLLHCCSIFVNDNFQLCLCQVNCVGDSLLRIYCIFIRQRMHERKTPHAYRCSISLPSYLRKWISSALWLI